MPAYLVVEHIITDAAKFEEYRIKVGPMIAKHGGRYLTRGGAWYNSPEYQPLIALRKQSTSDLDMMFTLEGV